MWIVNQFEISSNKLLASNKSRNEFCCLTFAYGAYLFGPDLLPITSNGAPFLLSPTVIIQAFSRDDLKLIKCIMEPKHCNRIIPFDQLCPSAFHSTFQNLIFGTLSFRCVRHLIASLQTFSFSQSLYFVVILTSVYLYHHHLFLFTILVFIYPWVKSCESFDARQLFTINLNIALYLFPFVLSNFHKQQVFHHYIGTYNQ